MSDNKEFTLVVTEAELNVVSAGLTELPFKVVASLIQKLQGQINSQQEVSGETNLVADIVD